MNTDKRVVDEKSTVPRRRTKHYVHPWILDAARCTDWLTVRHAERSLKRARARGPNGGRSGRARRRMVP